MKADLFAENNHLQVCKTDCHILVYYFGIKNVSFDQIPDFSISFFLFCQEIKLKEQPEIGQIKNFMYFVQIFIIQYLSGT